MPTVAVLVLNWNGRQWLQPCLDAVLAQDGPEREVWVIDNGSSDGSTDLVHHQYPTVRCLELPSNIGFGAAYNRAIDLVRAPYVVLLNNDTVVQPGWLAALVDQAKQHPASAAVGSKLLYLQRPSVVNHAGGVLTLLGAAFDVGLGRADGPRFSQAMPTGCATGAAVLLDRAAFLRAGGFDERFFAYFEDADLCWRFWLQGQAVLFEPRARVLHAYGGSSAGGRLAPFRIEHCQTNRLQNMFKHLELTSLAAAMPLSLAYDALRLAQFVRGRHASAARALIRGTARFWDVLPGVLEQRKLIQRQRTVSDADLLSSGVLATMRAAVHEWRRIGGVESSPPAQPAVA